MPKPNVHAWMEKTRHFLRLDKLAPLPRKIVVCVAGGVLIIAGIAMIVAPGPAFVFIPAGLLLLGSEFEWAEKWAQNTVNFFTQLGEKFRKKRQRKKRSKAPGHNRSIERKPPRGGTRMDTDKEDELRA